MYECKYPHLFSSIQLGNTVFRNRIFSSPTGVWYCDPEHRPIPETMAYYERKAKGGAASVCVGDAMIDGTHGLHGFYNMYLDEPELMPVLNKFSSQISRHGAVASLELYHTGSAANVSYYAGNEIYGTEAGESHGALGRPPVKVKAMTRDVMDRIVQQHRDAAKLAKSCGFGMITLHGAHGFLFHQFMSPTLNHRTDEYGGSFENRMRFPLECIRAVREEVGAGFPLEIRISACEAFEGGYEADYGCKIAEALDGLVDLIHVTAGSHEVASAFTRMCPSMFWEDNVNVEMAAEIKKHLKYTKVGVVGAINDPAAMERIIAEGKADVVELARELICDPDLPIKARYGRDEDVRKCMRCLTCFSNLLTHGQIVCALNPEIADEAEQKFARPAPQKKKVLVVGGGIAGMEAALTAAKRGHSVTLCEKGDRLGGVLLCEDAVPFKKNLRAYLEQQARFVKEAGVEIRLNTAVDKALAQEIGPDVIFLCAGHKPFVPPIPGIDGANVLPATEAYPHPEKVGQNVVILGAGLVGAELAVYLRRLGRDVTVLEMRDRMTIGDNKLHGMGLTNEFEKQQIRCLFNSKATEITAQGVRYENADGEQFIAADNVICALGLRPDRTLSESLRLAAPEFHEVGDCLTPGTIYDATRTAHQIALDIGERV